MKLDSNSIRKMTKLKQLFHKKLGKRFSLAETDSLRAMLELAAMSTDDEIQAAFLVAFESLDEKDQALIHTNVHNKATPDIAAPAPVEQVSTPTQHQPGELPEGVTKVTYRGQVVYKKDGEVIDNPFGEEGEIKESANQELPPGVTKVTYRGQIIYKKDGEVIEDPAFEDSMFA